MEKNQPAQHQDRQPGIESDMTPRPEYDDSSWKGSDRLKGKVALITGGDSGIGRAVAVAFAREGADVSIVYLEEDSDAGETKEAVEGKGGKCLLIRGDVGEKAFCEEAVRETTREFGHLDVLVNNAGEQHPKKSLADISEAQLTKTFRTNVFSFFFMTQAALSELGEGSCIINTASVTAYRGSPGLLDYSATKGAIVAFTRSLSGNLVDEGIRVNMVAPGPIWTPLIPATFEAEEVATFGSDTPMGRAGQPVEVGSCFVFLASDEARYITGQCLHPNGGEIVNG